MKNSISQKMIQKVSLCRGTLDQDSLKLIIDFITTQINSDGGFKGRTDDSDLYYTLFGIECLLALDHTPPIDRIGEYLNGFQDIEKLDFVHLSCLARCIAKMPKSFQDSSIIKRIIEQMKLYRSRHGGYFLALNAPHESIYGSFLALLAHEDLKETIQKPDLIIKGIEGLRAGDGAYADQPGLESGTTTVTAAAIVQQVQFGKSVDDSVCEWLLSCHSKHGGFLASKNTPFPDLLSTATALFALDLVKYPIEHIKDATLDFIEDMWLENGGFCSNISDDVTDCEYTFYGLLSMGILTGDE